MNRIVRGGIAGLIATAPMTLVIAGGRAAGLMRTPPPEQITARAEASVGLAQSRGEAFTARWMVAHLAYGAGCGVLSAVVRPRIPVPHGSATLEGLAFGGGVWAASYCAVMPALGLYPWPWDDDRSRAGIMVAAHGVFGVALAAVSRRMGSA